MIGMREKWGVGRNLASNSYDWKHSWHNNFMIPVLISGADTYDGVTSPSSFHFGGKYDFLL